MSDGPKDGEGSSIWNRLRRRKVVQWTLAYAAGAWGLLQGLQFVVDAFEWPNRVLKLGTVAALVGLPLVVAIAWFRGERGAQRVTRTELPGIPVASMTSSFPSMHCASLAQLPTGWISTTTILSSSFRMGYPRMRL